MNRQIKYFVMAVMLLPLALAAQDGPPRGPFGHGPTSRPYWGWGMRRMMEASGRMHRRDGEPTTEPSDQQWQEVAEYMKRDLPNAWRTFERASPDQQARMKRRIFAEFEETQMLRQTNQLELWKLRLGERKTMDDVQGLTRKWRQAPADEKSKIREEIRAKLKQFVLDTLQERELRIKKLEQQLDQVKDRVASDRQHINDILDHMLSRRLEAGPPRAERQDDRLAPATRPAD